MLLVALEHDVLRLRVFLQGRVEDLFLDALVEHHLGLERLEQLGARLLAALGRLLALGEQLLDLVVVGLEQRECVHRFSWRIRWVVAGPIRTPRA